MLIFTVFDDKAGAFLPPFTAKSAGLAIRMFEQLSSQPDHQFCMHAGDFTLFQVGTFDELTGEVKATPPSNMGTALQLKNAVENQ